MLDVIRRNSQSWVVKLIFAAIIITFVFWGASSVTSNSASVIAKVNGKSILRNDLVREANMEFARLRASNPQLGNLDADQQNILAMQVLQNMVQRTVLEQAATKLGLAISDIELSAVITAIPEFYGEDGRFDPKRYKEHLKIINMPAGQYEEMITSELLVEKLRDYVTSAAHIDAVEARQIFNFELERRNVAYLDFAAADYRDKVQPEESEIIAFYSEHKENYTVPAKANLEYYNFDMEVLAAQSTLGEDDIKQFYETNKAGFVEPKKYHVRHIMISLPLTVDDSDEAVLVARKKADSLLAEIKGGKKLSELAPLHSDDDGSKDNGGDLGWINEGELDPALDIELSGMKPGDISEPVRSMAGFHIFEMVDVKEARTKELEEVRQDIVAQLKEDAAYANMGSTLADVEDRIVLGNVFEEIGKEYNLTAKESGELELIELPAALNVSAESLAGVPTVPAGQMLPTAIDTGSGFMVVKVKSYTSDYVPELSEIKDKVIDNIKDVESIKLASDAATSAVKEIVEAGHTLPDALKAKEVKADDVVRFMGIVKLGPSEDLTQALFTTQVGEWIPRVFVVDDHAVIAKVESLHTPTDEEWESLSKEYTAALEKARKNEVFSLYLAQLYKGADIELKTTNLLGH